jgi:enoyl-CoA hydratase/carnithine racemase
LTTTAHLVTTKSEEGVAALELNDPGRRNVLSVELSRALADAPVPTLAVVDGPAIGAGVNFALACDVVITTPRAIFDPRFIDVGMHPGGGHLWRLQHRVGPQKPRPWCYPARR